MISFFPTQSQRPKQSKPHLISDNKVNIDFGKFQSFYHHLIDNPIGPPLESFFLLEDKVDIQEKFNKYDEQQRLMKQTQNTDFFTSNDDFTNPQQKKNIVFRPPSEATDKNPSKMTEKTTSSKITYFEINSVLRNGIANKSLFKKSFETKRQDKQHIEKLRQFLYEQQAVFFLIKGNVQLHKKVQESPSGSQDHIKSRQMIEALLEQTKKNSQSRSRQVALAALGNIFGLSESANFQQNLNFNEQEQFLQKKPQKDVWKKSQQVKESSFFSLINFKSLHHSHELQYYKFIPKSDSLLAKIPINHQFGSSYIRRQQEKLSVLSTVLLNSNKNDNMAKSETFKQLFDAFQEEAFKRQMNVTNQGRPNDKIYILDNDSEVEFTKRVCFKESQNVQGNKNIKIAALKGPILINTQIFLDSSKTVTNLLKTNSFRKRSLFQDAQNLDSEDDETKSHSKNKSHLHLNNQPQNERQQQNFDEAKEVEGLEKKLMIHKKRPSHSKKSSLFNEDRVYFGKDERTYFEFFLPESNTSSFTIKATSAYANVYSISLQKFIELTPERMKKKVSKSYEEFYVTCLRKSMERLQTFEKQVQISSQKKNTDLKQYAALASIQKLNRLSPQLRTQGNTIDVSPAKVQFQSRKEFRGLKRNDLVYKEGQILEKKMQMIKYKRKENQTGEALAKNFKKKIENLIVQNLKEINSLNTEKLGPEQKGLPINEINKYYAENLTQILNSQRANPTERRHILMDQPKDSYASQKFLNRKKQSIIEKQMYVDPDCFDPKKNKSVKISFMRKGHPCVKENQNFLKGVQMEEYTGSIKSHISVKINQTNKIKEQFLKIQSKCQSCKCYDDLESYRNLSSYNSERHRPCSEEHRNSSHDIKYHTMKIGVNWKTRYSSLGKVDSKTAYNEKGLQKKLTEMAQDDEPFEKVYNRIKVLKQKSLEKFNFNDHLLRRCQDVKVKKSRKKSAPLLI